MLYTKPAFVVVFKTLKRYLGPTYAFFEIVGVCELMFDIIKWTNSLLLFICVSLKSPTLQQIIVGN